MKKVFCSLMVLVQLTGCATMFHGCSNQIAVRLHKPDSEIYIDAMEMGSVTGYSEYHSINSDGFFYDYFAIAKGDSGLEGFSWSCALPNNGWLRCTVSQIQKFTSVSDMLSRLDLVKKEDGTVHRVDHGDEDQKKLEVRHAGFFEPSALEKRVGKLETSKNSTFLRAIRVDLFVDLFLGSSIDATRKQIKSDIVSEEERSEITGEEIKSFIFESSLPTKDLNEDTVGKMIINKILNKKCDEQDKNLCALWGFISFKSDGLAKDCQLKHPIACRILGKAKEVVGANAVAYYQQACELQDKMSCNYIKNYQKYFYRNIEDIRVKCTNRDKKACRKFVNYVINVEKKNGLLTRYSEDGVPNWTNTTSIYPPSEFEIACGLDINVACGGSWSAVPDE